MVGNLKNAIRGLAAVLVIVSAGCGGGSKRADAPPPPAEATPAPALPTPEPAPAGALRHEPLQAIFDEISVARQGGADGTAPIDYAGIAANAQKIADGAEAIQEDAPATLKDEDRVRYEGLKAQLKERAAALKVAADAQDKNGSNRSYLQLSSSCVRCHQQFGAPAGAGGGN